MKHVTFKETVEAINFSRDDDYERSQYECAKDLLVNLVYCEVLKLNYSKALKLLHQHKEMPDIDRRFGNDMTLLHIAFVQKDKVMFSQTTILIKELLSHGSSIAALDESGHYPLHYSNLYILKIILSSVLNFQDIPLAVIADSLRTFEALSTSWGYHNLDNIHLTINIAKEKGFKVKILPLGPLSFFEASAYFLSIAKNFFFETTQLYNIVMGRIERDRGILGISHEDISNYRIDPEPITDLMISYLSQIYNLRIIIMLGLDDFEIFQSCDQVENELRIYRFGRDFLPILDYIQDVPQIVTTDTHQTANSTETLQQVLQPVTAAMAGMALNQENCG